MSRNVAGAWTVVLVLKYTRCVRWDRIESGCLGGFGARHASAFPPAGRVLVSTDAVKKRENQAN